MVSDIWPESPDLDDCPGLDLHFLFGWLLTRDELIVKPVKANAVAQGVGPRAALSNLRVSWPQPDQFRKWCADAKVDSILGNCSRTLPSVHSGVACYLAFASKLDVSSGLHALLVWGMTSIFG